MKEFLKTHLSQNTINALRNILWPVAYFFEWLIWGGRIREKVLLFFLNQYFKSKFRREWIFSKNPQHFENYRIFLFNLGFSSKPIEPSHFNRGMFVSEMIKSGDTILDICCGDGFFTKRFYGQKSKLIDAIDLDPRAIKMAQNYNNGKNIRYHLLNANTEPFPQNKYNVIVWNGGICYFTSEQIELMVKKISSSLAEGGIFAGSINTGGGAPEPVQMFSSPNEINLFFKPFFKQVELKTASYKIHNGSYRDEVYWRCSNSPNNSFNDSYWKTYSNSQ